MDFNLIIGVDAVYQSTLTVSCNDVKIHKSRNERLNSLVNFVNSNEMTIG